MRGEKSILAFGIGLIVTAAFLASGYHFPDEYMQIIEFANLKIGGISGPELPWEYQERMRPFLQPTIFWGVHQVSDFFGMTSPFLVWSLFRLLLGLLGLLAVWKMARSQSDEDSEKTLLFGTFLFFLPWLWTRGSSESLSASLFVLCASLIFSGKEGKGSWLLSGWIGGLSFHIRYQSAFLLLGLIPVLWGVRKSLRPYLWSAGLGLGLFVGVLSDRWGYGEWTFPSINYFYQNLILDKAAQWGTKPFYAYLGLMHEHLWAPVSLVIMWAFFLSLRHWKNPFILAGVISFLGHSLVGHKEARFLFPVAALAPIYLVLAMKTPAFSKFATGKLGRVVLIWNLVGLAVCSVWPTRSEVLLQKQILSRFEYGDLFLFDGKNPYELGGNPMKYTMPAALVPLPVEEGVELSGFNSQTGVAWLSTSSAHQLNPGFETEFASRCQKVWQAFPDFVENFNWGNWLSRSGDWALYRCRLEP